MSTLDLFRLDGQAVVITGASSGLGAGFARALSGAGADLVLAARRADRLAELAAELRADGGRVETVTADVSLPEDCSRVAGHAIERFGRIDALVNNAGLGSAVSSLKETPEGFRRLIDVNLNGVFWMSQAAARRMTHGGSIVNVSSVLGLVAPRYPQAAYAASKAGVIGLTRNLAGEWSGRRGIRVNALCPGYFDSEMTAGEGDLLRTMVAEQSMLGRFGRQEELDGALLFLLSAASSYVTGTTLTVDGGLTSY
ncbi:SDR family NAD(P)-dependent oxidoreductase [Nocardioides daeguensis]|uniref:3-oxoacyl-[acyl-carrier-protein] reductase n=1 Tax=Nocardioides daeguensis TaxID=908359 RepID=A0ABP6V729_9ACTN|nr:SDR family oxidoreductase [Nocardioides daeguensis]MBV6726524.1 SDR family oxidoreductase [Nocardioides daeguensis]MCR1772367.1 SDR family oxidoreductase [Nocardioides daeguensis]